MNKQSTVSNNSQGWQFWIDRGGTFTDIVALRPDGEIILHKLLSENPSQYSDAPVQGLREVLKLTKNQVIPLELIDSIKIGTTVATNALLEKKGEPTVLIITQGLRDALRIGYQNRPDIFARQIILPEMLYQRVIEAEERYDAQGQELLTLNEPKLRADLESVYEEGIRSCAIVLMHGYRYPEHEKQVAAIALEIGFSQISVSHQVSPLIGIVSRGDTTVVDAYLSPVLQRYVKQFKKNLSSGNSTPNYPELMFMQSNGGLVQADLLQGKDSILSGPAGGIVGAVKTCQMAGFEKIIGFDMGGTSTDVSHYRGEYERTLEAEIAGVRLRTPMMAIHTVAAGGGSILSYDGARYRVGPESAGANPGPVAYAKGGQLLTVTDCNVLLGKLQPDFFPRVFGQNSDEPLNLSLVEEKFRQLSEQIKPQSTLEEIASGFLAIAVEKMANAIKKISLQKGYNLAEYTLCCFGGAGGQHACLIAEKLGIKQIFIHPYAGVLSAYGIGLAELRVIKERAIEIQLTEDLMASLAQDFQLLIKQATAEIAKNKIRLVKQQPVKQVLKLALKYEGNDSVIKVNYQTNLEQIITDFQQKYQQLYGFTATEINLVVASISVELIQPTYQPLIKEYSLTKREVFQPVKIVKMYSKDTWYDAPVYERKYLQPGDKINAPAIIVEATGTNIIEIGWQAAIDRQKNLIITKIKTSSKDKFKRQATTQLDPVLLEIFNNLFRSIAEQMGVTLQNTSYSVNIKERLDFSCAIFDQQGKLVANAPHIPVHLGSMGASVESLIQAKLKELKPGNVYLHNNPFSGGTHLPDLTVITPVFIDQSLDSSPTFYLASRGHHADIGGKTPGSMPPYSTNLAEEGILIDNFLLVESGKFQTENLIQLLSNSPYPARNIKQNIADLKAQIAANQKGLQELNNTINYYGLDTVKSYMQYVQDNAEQSMKKAIKHLSPGQFIVTLDNQAKIKLNISINYEKSTANIDFTGTSPQQANNFNAPIAVCKAAVLYVFRTLINDDIPLNAGCLKPLEINIPAGSLLNPNYPAAVVAGNVETSQNITDCLYGALGILAASQGTMNNFTFGNSQYQYYETICGGSGAGINHAGTDAVQTHMTNSRLTDAEVLEWRFPVLLKNFQIRPHSGGKGKYSGGNGVIRKITFIQSMQAGILSSRRKIPPFGLAGGNSAQPGKNYLETVDNQIIALGGSAKVEVKAGDTFVIETPGGGGYGKYISEQD